MAEQQPKTNWNFGGVWVFNPPEPQAHVTRLHGIPQTSLTTPAGDCTCIPGSWAVDLGEGSAGLKPHDYLFGQHVMKLRHNSLAVWAFATTVMLGYWSTDAVNEPVYDAEGNVTGFLFGNFYPWTLYYGKLATFSGNYSVDTWPPTDEWYLIGGIGAYAPTEGDPFDVYMMWNPESDPNAISRRTFDGLRPNVFRYVVPHDGGEPTTGMQNEFVTVRPYYP